MSLLYTLVTLAYLEIAAASNITGTSNGNTTATPEWLPEALRDIAYYLRAHKFNEYDRRYESDAKLARREYFTGFPRPPLRSLHWEVHKYCEESFLECANYLRKRVKMAGRKRSDDTAVVIKEQGWTLRNNSKQIEIVNEECKKLENIDDAEANPFEGPLERFQWRSSASYFMCWYTLKSELSLKHLLEDCDNFASCLDSVLGPHNKDIRADDTNPYNCALYSFCPDPCCPFKHLTRLENCWNTLDNPCFQANPPGQRECVVNRSKNMGFSDLILNRWNVSCNCPEEGFEWNSFYGICIDIDECASDAHNCDEKTQVCTNSPGSFKCVCRWGHSLDSEAGKCIQSPSLIHLIAQMEQPEENATNTTIWWKSVLRVLRLNTYISNNKSQNSKLHYSVLTLTIIFTIPTSDNI